MKSSASFKLEMDIPEQLPDADIQILCAKVRATGCKTSKDAIIQSHVRLAAYMAGKYIKYNRRRQDDLIAQAMFGLTKAVDWAQERMRDNNITPYIGATIQRYLREFLAEDQVITVERRAFKKMMESGEAYHYIPYIYQIDPVLVDEENPEGSFQDVTPIVEDEMPGIEYDELHKYLHRGNDRALFIIDKLVQGYTFQEIGNELGISKQRIGIIVQELRGRCTDWKQYHEAI